MFKRKGTRLLAPGLVATLLYSAGAAAGCVLPAAPSHIPDGGAASEQEMAAAMRTIKQYNADVVDYDRCLEFEAKQNHISKADFVAHHDNAVATLGTVVDHFNEQVRRFKARKS